MCHYKEEVINHYPYPTIDLKERVGWENLEDSPECDVRI